MTVYVDVDDTLIIYKSYSTSTNPHGFLDGKAFEPNHQLIARLLSFKGDIFVWSGGGRDYARKVAALVLPSTLRYDVGDKWLDDDIKAGDIIVDDQPHFFEALKDKWIYIFNPFEEWNMMTEQNSLACKLCATNNGSGCTTPQPDPNHWICKAWLTKANKQLKPKEQTDEDKLAKAVRHLYMTLPRFDIDEGVKLIMEAVPKLATLAGYQSPGELDAWAKANGYVQLDEDQKLPLFLNLSPDNERMFREDWRKIKQE